MKVRTDKGKKALVLGATGLVGGYLMQNLVEDESYSEIRVLSRRPLDMDHPKVVVTLANLLDLDSQKELFEVDQVFCCIGTTQAKTPDKQEYPDIDYGIPVKAAQLAKDCGASVFAVISAMGANSASKVFYNRLKGEMEQDVARIGLPNLVIARPSLIGGKRQEERKGERWAQRLMGSFDLLVPKPYKMIHPAQIASALKVLANDPPEQAVVLSHQLKQYAL